MKLKQIISAALITALLPLSMGITVLGEDSFEDLDGLEAVPDLGAGGVELTLNGDYLNADKGRDDASLLGINSTSKRRLYIPDSYNSDPDGLLYYINSPRDQGHFGSCWAFASTSCMETLLLKQDGNIMVDEEEDQSYNFSELHAVLACSNSFLLDGEYGVVGRGIEDGGSMCGYAMYTTRNEDNNLFAGPALETDMEYTDDTTKMAEITAEDMKNAEAIKYFPGSFSDLYFSSQLDEDDLEDRNDLIKEYVLTYGSVAIAIQCGEAVDNNFENFAEAGGYTLFYESTLETADHGVTIVGYDDDFDGDLFETAGFANPGMDGTFLVKNSWGTDWGSNGGYFYMSYASQINEICAFGNLISRDTYEYEYDYAPYYPLYTIHTLNFLNSSGNVVAYGGVYANNFEKKIEQPEELDKVSLYVANGNTNLRFYIDTDDSDGINNDMQQLYIKDAADGSPYTVNSSYIYVPYAGHYVFELEEPVALEGDFTVAVYAYSYSGEPVYYEGSCDLSEDSVFLNHKYSGNSYISTSINGTFEKVYDVFQASDDEADADDYKWDLMLNAYTSETPVYVTIDGTVYEADYGTVLSDFLAAKGITDTVYEETDGEENSYAPVDTDMELTKHITLYTGSYIYAPAITMDNYQASDDGEAIRFVGEITDEFDDAVEKVIALGFVYSVDSGSTTETIVCDNELYESLEDYTAPDNTYLFKSGELTAADYIVSAYVSYVISGETDTVTVYTEEKTITTSASND
ncbi:MAG: C1 family peptidase [Clostridiales bacterium]|nr:C1 family peptidase [Clostridiales bacterium]